MLDNGKMISLRETDNKLSVTEVIIEEHSKMVWKMGGEFFTGAMGKNMKVISRMAICKVEES